MGTRRSYDKAGRKERGGEEGGGNLPLTRSHGNSIIDSQQTNGGFVSTFQALDLAHRRFDDAGREVISYLPIEQIETVLHAPLVRIALGCRLRFVMDGTKLAYELG